MRGKWVEVQVAVSNKVASESKNKMGSNKTVHERTRQVFLSHE